MMGSADVHEVLGHLESKQISFWIDGGWGIDALVGEQTRPHDDLDLVIALDDSDAAIKALGTLGFRVTEDERPTRFVVADPRDRRIDFHTVRFDDGGGGNQTLQDGRVYRYPPEGFKERGIIGGREVPCLTAEVQVECHVGYDPDEKDLHDMHLLRDRLGAVIPPVFD